jgi:hypothetical protein
VGEGDGSGLESLAQAVRHGFSVAEIAHGKNPLLWRTRCRQALALLTRSLGKGGLERLDTFTVPIKGASSGSYPPFEKYAPARKRRQFALRKN